MNDMDLEERLKHYRPAGPPSGLRGRVLETEPPLNRRWISIAALLVLIVVLRMLAAGERASVRARIDHSTNHEAVIREFAERLGGDDFAFVTARAVISMSTTAGDGE